MQRLKTEEQCFYKNVQCGIVKNWKEQEARRLSSLGIRTPLSQIPLWNPLLF